MMVGIAGWIWNWNNSVHVLHVLGDNAHGNSNGDDPVLCDWFRRQ